MIELPPHLPSRAPEIPPQVVRMLMHKLWEKHLKLHEGIHGVIESLYRNERRSAEDEQEVRISRLVKAHECWPFIVADTQQFVARQAEAREQRKAGLLHAPETNA